MLLLHDIGSEALYFKLGEEVNRLVTETHANTDMHFKLFT